MGPTQVNFACVHIPADSLGQEQPSVNTVTPQAPQTGLVDNQCLDPDGRLGKHAVCRGWLDFLRSWNGTPLLGKAKPFGLNVISFQANNSALPGAPLETHKR